MQMPKSFKKNNHQVTRALLSKWSRNHNGKSGIFYFDITRQKKDFSQGNAASFAVIPNLYVPLRENGTRNDDLENEFSVDESALGLLINSTFSWGKKLKKINMQKKAIRSCISLGFRSAYYTVQMLMILGENGVPFEERHRISLEMMKKTLENRYSNFRNWKFVVVKNLSSDLLINEQPFRDWTIHKNSYQFVTMPLTPRSILIGAPSPTGQFMLEWTDDEHNIVKVETHNNIVIETARHFIASATEQQLDSVIPQLTEDLVKSRMSTDRVVTLQSNSSEEIESQQSA